MAWKNMKFQTKALVLILLTLVTFIALFVTGLLEKAVADIGRREADRFDKEYSQKNDFDIEDYRGGELPDEDYMDYIEKLNKLKAGGMLLLAANLHSICLQGEKAVILDFEFLSRFGILHPRAPEAWFRIMNWEANQDNARSIVVGMGYAYYHLFNDEYMRLTEDFQPHPQFEMYRERINMLMRRALQTVALPKKPKDELYYNFGEPSAPGSKASDMVRSIKPLERRHEIFKSSRLRIWFQVNNHPW